MVHIANLNFLLLIFLHKTLTLRRYAHIAKKIINTIKLHQNAFMVIYKIEAL